MHKLFHIFLNSLPVIVMIALIPLVLNDYLLTSLYVLIIVASLSVKCTRDDLVVLGFGFIVMLTSEYLFIRTGVETFNRNTLWGLMPLWLPFLWAYGFVAIKRSAQILVAGF